MQPWILVLAVLVAVCAPVLAIFVWLKAFGGPDGERLQKLRMQGPFVPLSEEDIKKDEERVHERQARKEGVSGDR